MASTNSTVSGTVTFETDDDLSETNIGAADAQGNRVDYVERGCGFSVNHTNDTITIGSTGTRANYVIVENPSSHVAWHLYPDQDTDIALPNASATNHVFIAYDESTDAISYHIDDDDTAPSEPSLKIGTVDTANDTSTETNRDPSIAAEEADVDKLLGLQRLDAVFDAMRIRRVAGVPEGITVGVATPGDLAAQSQLTIASESDASTAAASGDGSEDEPYVIKDRDMDNSESSTDPGINWTDTDATYDIMLYNCDISGYQSNIYMNSKESTLKVLNCRLGSTAGAQNNIDTAGYQGRIELNRTRVENGGSNGVSIEGLNLIGAGPPRNGEFDARYCEFVNNLGFQVNVNLAAADGVTIENCYAEASVTDAHRAFRVKDVEKPIIRRCRAKVTSSATASAESFLLDKCERGLIEECWSEENGVDDAFEIVDGEGCEIAHCVGDSTNQSIGDVFGSSAADAGHYVHHLYGDTTTERAVVVNGKHHTVIHDIYTESPQDDGIEIITGTEDCTIIDPVPLPENVGGEVIDDDGTRTEILRFQDGAVTDVNNNIADAFEKIR